MDIASSTAWAILASSCVLLAGAAPCLGIWQGALLRRDLRAIDAVEAHPEGNLAAVVVRHLAPAQAQHPGGGADQHPEAGRRLGKTDRMDLRIPEPQHTLRQTRRCADSLHWRDRSVCQMTSATA